MKLFSVLLLICGFSAVTTAQIKVDSSYAILAKGAEDKPAMSYLLADLGKLIIKENATGKTCVPVSAQYSFSLQNELFQTNDLATAQKYLSRVKPKDSIYIEKIVLPNDCFTPPKTIVIVVQ